MRNVLLLGAGKIGSMITEMLVGSGDYAVTVADRDPAAFSSIPPGRAARKTIDVSSGAELRAAMKGMDAVLSALPFYLNVGVAEAARDAGTRYFDLTEDVETTRRVRAIAAEGAGVFVPQCGLAPGFISIVAYELARRFQSLRHVHMRVGALPKYPSNVLKYNLTWSTDGLINEYCNPCEAIYASEKREVLPLEGLEHFSLDGDDYEAFNTSGGLGTLCETLAGQVEELNYKTVRYPGHCELVRLLANELRLRLRRDVFKQVLEEAIPITQQDVVLIFVSVSGTRDGRLTQETYAKKIYSAEVGGKVWSAIQLTTSAGICGMLDLMLEGKLPSRGFVRQEDARLADFLSNRFGRHYA
ncbi:MAG: saccharopine dehydrogenase NADP-binding domain-containing protein [Planctomycetes bacterium]|nr:saccharopine dehydrogenase NADP-binding domain-containing protein [Planctomycetota bacterium]